MICFAQLPGADTAIAEAASHGWEAAFLVVVIFAILVSFGYVLKRILDAGESREVRMSERITALESEIRQELFTQIKTNSDTMNRMIAAADKISTAADKMLEWSSRLDRDLAARPCLMRVVHQGQFLEELEQLYDKHAKQNGLNNT